MAGTILRGNRSIVKGSEVYEKIVQLKMKEHKHGWNALIKIDGGAKIVRCCNE